MLLCGGSGGKGKLWGMQQLGAWLDRPGTGPQGDPVGCLGLFDALRCGSVLWQGVGGWVPLPLLRAGRPHAGLKGRLCPPSHTSPGAD